MNYYPFTIFLGIGVGIAIYLIGRLWKIRRTPGAIPLIGAITSVAIWSFGFIFEILFTEPGLKVLLAKFEYLGISSLSLMLFIFALIYSGRDRWLTAGRLTLLASIPAATLLLALTNDWHHLLWIKLTVPGNLIGPLSVSQGPWYYVNVAYSYALLLGATIFFVTVAVRRQNLYRAQAIIMLVGMTLPWGANLVYMLHPVLDWTPLAFTLTTIALEIGFVRFGIMDILPVAESHVFNAMKDGVIVTDVRGRIVEINPSAQRIFQQREGNLIGKGIQQILPAWIEWNTQTGTAFEVSHEISYGEGPSRRIYGLRITPILDRRGQLTGHMAILTDVTDEKLAQSQMLLQGTALEAAENGIVITDVNGKIEWANPAFTRLTGYQLNEAVGKNPKILKSGRQPEDFYKNLWDTVLAGKVWRGELVNRRKDGYFYNEEMTITPLIENGKVTRFIAIKQDVTKRKNAEEQLRQAHEQAVAANRMKTQLLASVSHDLRTPLGAIMGYAEILETGVLGKVNDGQQNAAAEILDSANRLLAFVNNLIGQAQLETGRVIIRPGAFRPAELTEGVDSLVGLTAHKKGLALETEIDPTLPEQLRGDPYWLRQILQNLVNNAVKFTKEGTVRVRIFLPDENHWAMQVTDTGIGIPEESRQSIFEAFRQVEGRETLEGSGLGLSIVSQLAALMNGTIDLQSEVGQGSTFTITLPLVISKEEIE